MTELELDYSNTASYSPREKTVAAKWVDKYVPEEVKTEGKIMNIVSGVIRGQTVSQEKLDEIIRKVRLTLGDA